MEHRSQGLAPLPLMAGASWSRHPRLPSWWRKVRLQARQRGWQGRALSLAWRWTRRVHLRGHLAVGRGSACWQQPLRLVQVLPPGGAQSVQACFPESGPSAIARQAVRQGQLANECRWRVQTDTTGDDRCCQAVPAVQQLQAQSCCWATQSSSPSAACCHPVQPTRLAAMAATPTLPMAVERLHQAAITLLAASASMSHELQPDAAPTPLPVLRRHHACQQPRCCQSPEPQAPLQQVCVQTPCAWRQAPSLVRPPPACCCSRRSGTGIAMLWADLAACLAAQAHMLALAIGTPS